MSFPYRLITVFTHNQTAVVLWLRALNISLFAASLPLYRRLLLKTGASRALAHSCLAVFVLVPVVPLLAAQINYDNLFVPLAAATLLLTALVSEDSRRYKRINTKLLAGVLILGLLGSLVKYAFLPIFAAVVIYLGIRLGRAYGFGRRFWLNLGFGATLMTRRTRYVLAVTLVLSLGLFTQRYGVNLARYHTPLPDCAQVLSVERCMAYGPWTRDHREVLQNNQTPASKNPLTYTADWFYGMWLRSFFAVAGPSTRFQTRGPLVVPGISAIVFAGATLLASLVALPRLLRRYNRSVVLLCLGASLTYVGVLWLNGYQSFLQTGQATAINGRYLIPILPPLLVVGGLAIDSLLERRQTLKLAVAGTIIICLLWGGGALTYILRSNDAWYWPHYQIVRIVNHAIRHVVGPITPGYRHPTQFMSRN